MTFQPVVPLSGYAGWRFLTRTMETQLEAHSNSAVRQRDTDYFREEIGKISSPEELVADRRLLSVALGAFGLDDDINNKFFMQKVLSDGYSDPEALANRLSDKRYLAFSKAFGFGEGILPRNGLSSFPDEIIDAYKVRQFEIDVGEQNESMRLALGAKRELSELAGASSSNTVKWYTIMGNPPLRAVFESALGMPDGFGAIDVDKQLEMFQTAAEKRFGTSEISDFIDDGLQEDLVRLFLVRSEIESFNSSISSGSIALTLLSQLG